VKMEQSFQDNRRYATTANGAACPVSAIASTGLKYFTLACAVTGNSGVNDAYTITATGVAGSPTAAFTYTVTPTAKATTATKWSVTSTACWVIDSAGGCY
ncbi:MAG: fimbrial assembly protein, partial [Propionivibrio sp.]